MIHAALQVLVIEEPNEMQQVGAVKPFVRIKNPDGCLDITFNQFGMLFGAVKGSAARLVEQGKLPANNVPPEWL